GLLFASLSYTHRRRRLLHSFPTRRSSDLSDGIGVVEETWLKSAPHLQHSFTQRQLRRGSWTLSDPDLMERWARDETRVMKLPSRDRKSTRLNSSHEWISYAVFCLKKKTDQ